MAGRTVAGSGLEATLSLIDKAGSIENIQRWCIWTPHQLSLLEMADQMPRVVLIGGNGTGKTLMLETYGLKTAEKNPDDEVIFAVNQNDRQLLLLQLENKFKEFEN